MELQRFEELAQAWGGELDAWPAAERDRARRVLADRPDSAQAALTRAAALDRLLDASPSPAPRAALRDAVIATAPTPRRGWRAATGWLSGAGLAAACAAGVGVFFAEPRPQDRGVRTLIQASSELGGSLSPIEAGGRDA